MAEAAEMSLLLSEETKSTSEVGTFESSKDIDSDEDDNVSDDKVFDGIDLSRRAVAIVEVEEDVCSICLDNFTVEDPGKLTDCGHSYHIQCIMQWAQRSRECPMCFKPLKMKDPDAQDMLPFGEYMPPERGGSSQPPILVGIETWELERLLHRLALVQAGGGHHSSRRHSRSSRRRTSAFTRDRDQHHRSSRNKDPSSAATDPADGRIDQRASGTGAASSSDSPETDGSASGLPSHRASEEPWTLPARRTTQSVDHSSTAHFIIPSGGSYTRSISFDDALASSDLQDGAAQRATGFFDFKAKLAAASVRCKESLTRTTTQLRRAFSRTADGSPAGSST